MIQRAISHLESMAPLDCFWIYRSASTKEGVIHYWTPDGQSWTLMEDDEALFDECISALERIDCPIFTDGRSMLAHIEKLKSTSSRRST